MMLTLLFPGQGSQYPGMHQKWLEYKSFSSTLEEASDHLKLNLSSLLEEGSSEQLQQTSLTQPLILTVSYGILRVLKAEGVKEGAVLGHSLGSYTAMVASGAISFKDGLSITRKRGEMVEELLGRDFEGGLVAVMGLEEVSVREILNSHPLLDITNVNAQDQVVVGGKEEDITCLMVELKEKRIRAVKLPVSHPFHTRYLKKMVPLFAEFLTGFSFHTPAVYYISPSLAQVLTEGETIKKVLTQELTTPVRFTDSLRKVRELGANCFLEVGPRDVLSRLTKRVLPEVRAFSIDVEGLEVLGRLGHVS
ncbi:MAG: Polyketide biosynthesis malonyl CoA-acyl carrier protein transacylase PksC [candidate division WS2 bacterium]|uniref:Malonyl CoA-acyl carrier protein transacylase n=1 Tax=Psychracetigena formicireducens TaxID=2986056 RepID=A0A9E2F1X2_PSYF1|nr:Polyketide biosynthesis malonyl CoA-acyl carrier protein transacylase PksC [Candidatus Psychracetigena formicireducens]MBT9145107.1 Polyketide biosynthesis malonyl CoA-acyl carrier protein transacylase PksC [Candidatus Psychracetigena formicireducens]MBT9150285.1 Polyketide biosynthesis malonyl CoA-acyl carrier protein transacylase PksC [Candidatus Psychracetigena formicireducens]